MKKPTAALLTLAFLVLVFAPTHSASPAILLEDCSCTAPDGSCSASVSSGRMHKVLRKQRQLLRFLFRCP
jgi:hypothetical protein